MGVGSSHGPALGPLLDPLLALLVLCALAALQALARRAPKLAPRPGLDLDDLEVSEPVDRPILVATRVHLGDASRPPDLSQVTRFVKEAGLYAQRVCIAVGVPDGPLADREREQVLAALVRDVRRAARGAAIPVDVVPVTPWGKFVPALNALTALAASKGFDRMLLQSIEAKCSALAVKELEQALGPGTSCAGAALPGHRFVKGGARKGWAHYAEVPLAGDTCPWNTLCLWNVSLLGLYGFPLVADGLHAGIEPGVEEVAAVAACARKCRLVQCTGVAWDTSFADPKRRQWQEQKMASKVRRPAKQLEALGLSGTVEHVVPGAKPRSASWPLCAGAR